MSPVTRNIDPDSARDLLERAARACLAFAGGDGPAVQPVALIWRGERVYVGVPERADPQPRAGQEVVLLVDEGIYFFDLRAIYMRGLLEPAAPPGEPGGRRWFAIAPHKTLAWDYGALREVTDGQ